MAYESETEVIQHELEDEYAGEGEDEMEDEYEDESALEGEGWLGAIGNIVGNLLGEGEAEGEYEDESAFEFEAEDEINPIRKIYPDAMMEHLGEMAFEAETEDEAAEHFLPLIGMAASKLLPIAAKALAPMAKRALPKIARAVTKAAPRLTRGIGKMTKTLHRNPQTRHLLKTMPAIARRTVGSIARQAAHGRRITSRGAVKTLATQARRVLAHPRNRRQALRRHRHLERRFHRGYGRGIARPHRGVAGQPYVHAAGVAGAAPGQTVYAAPGVVNQRLVNQGFVTGGAGTSRGAQVRYGQCTCAAPCPTCGVSSPQAITASGSPTPSATTSPAYCRCCGQVLR